LYSADKHHQLRCDSFRSCLSASLCLYRQPHCCDSWWSFADPDPEFQTVADLISETTAEAYGTGQAMT